MNHRMRWRTLRRYTATTAVLLTSAAGLSAVATVGTGLVSAVPASAATGCSVAYTVPSQWNVGFSVAITVTNLGSPVTSWTLGYSYSGNQQLAQGWSGNWSQSGRNVTVTNASWNGSLGTGGSAQIGANFSYSGTNTSPSVFTLNGVTCTGQVSGSTGSIVASASALSVAQGGTGTVGISLSAAPAANVTVATSFTSGNNGLSVTGGGSLTFTPSNFATSQNVTITANSSGTGAATFTVSAAGYASVTITATETSSGGGGGGGVHVADPFTGAKSYLNPNYVKEVQAQATTDGSSAEAAVANSQTAIWLDTIAAINGGGTTGRTGLQQQLTNAAAAATSSTPVVVEIVDIRPAGPGLRGAGVQRRNTGDGRRANRVRDAVHHPDRQHLVQVLQRQYPRRRDHRAGLAAQRGHQPVQIGLPDG